jgi:hypothetical protein
MGIAIFLPSRSVHDVWNCYERLPLFFLSIFYPRYILSTTHTAAVVESLMPNNDILLHFCLILVNILCFLRP